MVAAPPIDGPRLDPAAGGPARKLVVLLHGYGADGNDLLALGQHWQRLLPQAAFVAPNAPERTAMGFGYQWFTPSFDDPAPRWKGVERAAPVLDAFLDAELARRGLADKDMALVGFSQGTMMALHVGLRRAAAPAAILGYSGALVGGETLSRQVRVKPPILLIHGDADQVIPVEALHDACGHLAAAGLAVEWHICRGLPHGIDAQGLDLGGRFLARAFAS